MKYIILIIVGMAGVVLGTYLGRRRKMKKEGRPFGETQDRQNHPAKNRK